MQQIESAERLTRSPSTYKRRTRILEQHLLNKPETPSLPNTIKQSLQSWYEVKMDCLTRVLFQRFAVLKLTSKPLLLWNFINYVLIYYAFITNFFTIFIVSVVEEDRASSQPFHRVSKYSAFIVLTIDLLFVRWRVEGLDQHQRKRTHKITSRRYCTYYLVVDLMVLTVILMDIANFKFGYWKIVLYLKAFIYQQIKEQIEIAVDGHGFLEFLFKTIRLLFFVSFWSFFFAAVFVNLQLQEILSKGFYYRNGFLWLTASPALDYLNLYEQFDWYVWFEYALFFVMQMVRGCGLGVPAPRHPLAMLWYNIANVTMTVLFWYFTDKVIWVVNKYMEKNKFVENLSNFKQMKKVRLISEKDYNKYGRFFKISLNSTIEAVHLESSLHSMLPQTLLKDFNYAFKQHFIQRFKLDN